MSVKSKLYELIQLSQNSKYPLELTRPEFSYEDDFDQTTNTHHYTCIATMAIDGAERIFRSDVATKKADSNQNVCEKIYKCVTNTDAAVQISKNTIKPKVKITESVDLSEPEIMIDKYLLILIDYENVSVEKELAKLQRFLDRVTYVDLDSTGDSDSETDSNEPMIEVIKFAGHASSMKANADIVVRSTRKDAVDHYIGFYLGQRLGENPSLRTNASIHVLSRDHFASCLEDFCPNVVHNVDVDDLIESIQKLSESTA